MARCTRARASPRAPAIRELLRGTHVASLDLLGSLDEASLSETRIADGAAVTVEWIVWHVIEYEVHHRGEISLALGLLGRPGLEV